MPHQLHDHFCDCVCMTQVLRESCRRHLSVNMLLRRYTRVLSTETRNWCRALAARESRRKAVVHVASCLTRLLGLCYATSRQAKMPRPVLRGSRLVVGNWNRRGPAGECQCQQNGIAGPRHFDMGTSCVIGNLWTILPNLRLPIHSP